MRLALLVLLSFFAGLLYAQAPYTVSSGTTTWQSIGNVPGTQVHKYASEFSKVFAPPGFSYNYFGQTFTEFRTCRFGLIKFGSNIGDFYYLPRQHYATDYIVAASWMALAEDQAVQDPVRWDFQNGVLIVEWREMLMPVDNSQQQKSSCSFQIEIDTNTGEIEMRYGAMTGPGIFRPGAPFNVCVTGGITSWGKPFVAGECPGYVDSDGAITTWPDGQYIRFTPNTSTGTVPDFRVESDGQVWGYGNGKVVDIGDTMSAQNLTIQLDDADGDDVSVDGVMQFNGNGPGSLDPGEFSSAAQPVSYTLNPATGEFEAGMYYVYITLVATDAQGGKSVFYMKYTIRDNSWIGLPPEIACSTGSGSSPLFAALLAIIACVWWRRPYSPMTLMITRLRRWPSNSA